jgi:DNA-binding NarL/FixJ family response regulator
VLPTDTTPGRPGRTCVVVDDHPAIVEAAARVLSAADFSVVGRAETAEAARPKIMELRPALVLLDVRLGAASGLKLAREVPKLSPESAVVLYTGSEDSTLLNEALDAGVQGIVLKNAPIADLVRAAETVIRGGTYVDPVVAGEAAIDAPEGPQLTSREREVLRLLAEGLSNEEIGKQLFISAETVRTHIRKAMDKLGASTRTQAVARAIRRRLIA